MKTIVLLLISVGLLYGCGSSEEDNKRIAREVIAEANGNYFLWDGILINLGSSSIECGENLFYDTFYMDSKNKIRTDDCDEFMYQLTECLAAEDSDEIKEECFRHDRHRK